MKQSYQLRVLLTQDLRLVVGRLGSFNFPAGEYVYTGSARKNLEARVARHLAGAKKLHWHIDYLLASPNVRVVEVELSEVAECELNRGTAGTVLVPRFGATDCRSGCGSHLKYLGQGV